MRDVANILMDYDFNSRYRGNWSRMLVDSVPPQQGLQDVTVYKN
jgi:hypothetical protein